MTIVLILLLISLIICAMTGNFDIAALLGVTFAYIGLTHFGWLTVSNTVNNWFWFIWLVALALTFIAKFWSALLSTLVSLGAAIFVVVSMVGLPANGLTNNMAIQPTPSATATEPATSSETTPNPTGESIRSTAPSGSGTSTQTSRNPRFVQSWDPNTDFKARAKGLWDDLKSGAASVKGATTKMSESMGHDARYLAIVAWYEGITTDKNDWQSLVTADKSYLSDKGIALYNKIQKRWTEAKVSIQNAPKNLCNTGMDNGRFVANATCGLSGNVKALVFTHPDNKQTIYLVRCANPVLPPKAHHSVPKGRTDNTPPPTKKPQPSKKPTPTPTPDKTKPPVIEKITVCRISDKKTVTVTKEESKKPGYAPVGSPKCADKPEPTPTPTPTETPKCPPGTTGTPPECKEPPKEEPKCPPGTTGTPPNCEKPEEPKCPPGTTGTPPKCEQPPKNDKDPSLDPGPRGNAPRGSGKNDDPGPGPKTTPRPQPTQDRVNPPAPQPTHNSEATAEPREPEVIRPSEPVDPEPGANTPDSPATGTPADPAFIAPIGPLAALFLRRRRK